MRLAIVLESVMTRGVAERNARTAEDLRLHAEKAAFEGQTLRTFFNSLQARTIHKLSPETRLFAEICYEKKLAHCVATALIECSSSKEGREKASEIASSNESKTLRMTWKPLLDQCSQLLRGHKLETTNARLSRLSDHWSKSKDGEKQIERMKGVVQHVLYNSIERARTASSEILDWIDLYSVQDVPMKETLRSRKEDPVQGRTNVVVVDRAETFSEAEAFLLREVETDAKIHVIVGNEDDCVRFYKRVSSRFSSYGVQLNWKDREYGRHISPRIVIGSREFFASQYTGRRSRALTSAVVIHAESKLEDSFEHRFEQENLDDYLTEIFVLTTITMNHYDEIKECIEEKSDDLLKLMRSWPEENQVLDKYTVLDLWYKCNKTYGPPLSKNRFLKELRSYTQDSIANRMKLFKVPPRLQKYVESRCSSFVQFSIAARNAEFGQDYVLFSERSSGKLELKVRLKKQRWEGSFGVQQFLELRHGCAMTPYRVSTEMVASSALIQSFDRVLIIQRANPFRKSPQNLNVSHVTWRKETKKPKHYQSSLDKFPIVIATDAKVYKNCLMIVVCYTNKILQETFNYLKEEMNGVNVAICETSLGVLNESAKNPSETLVVCTTSACFEGWTFVPRTRDKLHIYVYHHNLDTTALEIACDHAKPLEVQSFTCDSETLKQLIGAKGPESSWWLTLPSFQRRNYEPEELIEKYSKDKDINDLIRAKKLLHKRMKDISIIAKLVTARLPDLQWQTVDSPSDIACNGFLERSRTRMTEVISMKKEVERMISEYAMTKGISKTKLGIDDIKEIAKRYMIDDHELRGFVKSLRSSNKPISFFDAKTRMRKRFRIGQDAEVHWEECYDRQSRKDELVFALSPECISSATAHLQNLKLVPFPENYRQSILQCSDRNLESCTMYFPESQFDDELLNLEGFSFESYANANTANDFRQLCDSTALMDIVVLESANKGCPLYLFPRRCYSKLTRDLFDSGVLICRNYEEMEETMHSLDTIELPIIIETSHQTVLERRLKTESSVMEYGSIEWMEWMARRLRFYDYHQEAVRFYHRIVAERDYCLQDESLIRRLRDSLTDSSLEKASSSIEKLRVDAFVYNSMDILNRGERLVRLNPPFASVDALCQLTNFIRSRRMAPS